ncbi:hypothetical protein U9M48_034908 [Paspalum notatum var. saurae]|uniref:F-box domain-containing protein n=1 Tax=Paspalum notatum var. saurae TaxID=547442 RepID=A0AAQ3UAX3_PASNO
MALPQDIVEAILLRFPPSEPASLVRAALVCKPWCRLISGRRFRRRFCEFHRSPPRLGFLLNIVDRLNYVGIRFVPATPFRPPRANHTLCVARDARHGRVVLEVKKTKRDEETRIVVWDPTTDERWELPTAPLGPSYHFFWTATVVCAGTVSGTCDHLDCRGEPFIVVAVGDNKKNNGNGVASLWVYSSASDAWGKPTPLPKGSVVGSPTALVGKTLYFRMGAADTSVLLYDLATQKTCIARLPLPHGHYESTLLMTMEDGGLGIAVLEDGRLSLWSVEANVNPNGDIRMECTQIRVIELDKHLPVDPRFIGSGFLSYLHDVDVFFVGTIEGFFTFDPKSGRVRKVYQEAFDDLDGGIGIYGAIPYMNFYTPVLGTADSTGDTPSMGASSASKA